VANDILEIRDNFIHAFGSYTHGPYYKEHTNAIITHRGVRVGMYAQVLMKREEH